MALTPTVTRQSKESEVDKSSPKIVAIALVGSASSFFAVFRFTELLSSLTPMNALYAWLAIAGFLVVALLQTFFIKSAWKLFLICLAEILSAASLLWESFYPVPSVQLAVGTGIFLAFLFFASYEGSRFLSQALSIRFAFVSRGIFARAATAFLVFLAAVSYVWYFDLGKFNPEDGYALMTSGIFSAEPVLHVWFPGASLNQTADVFFRKVAESELRKLPKPSPETGGTETQIDFNILSKQQQELLIQGTAETIRTSFERTLGIPIPKDAFLKDVLYNFFEAKVKSFSDKANDYFGLIVALAVFLILKGFFIAFGWLIRFFAFLVYRFLLLVGFAYVSVETRNREFILLS